MIKLPRLRRDWLTRQAMFEGEYLLEAVWRRVLNAVMLVVSGQVLETRHTAKLRIFDEIDTGTAGDVRTYIRLAVWDSVR